MLDKTRQDWASRAGELEIEGRAFINGRYEDALSGGTRATISPGNGQKLANVANCGIEDADKAVKNGLALRWAFIGPTEVAHLNATQGFLGFVDGLGDMMKDLARDAKPDYPWTREDAAKIHAARERDMPLERIPDFQRWRDRRIMALRQHLDRADNAADD